MSIFRYRKSNFLIYVVNFCMYDPCTSSILVYTCKDLVQRAEPLYKERRYQRKGNKAPGILGNKCGETQLKVNEGGDEEVPGPSQRTVVSGNAFPTIVLLCHHKSLEMCLFC